MSSFLETSRLLIQPPSLEHLEEQIRLQSNSELMKFMPGGPRSEEEVKNRLLKEIWHYQKHQFSMGSVFEKNTQQFIGRAGIFYLELNDQNPDLEIGLVLHKNYWNKGYGTELLASLIQWGFSHTATAKIIACTHPDNQHSQRIILKVGMSFDHSGLYKNQPTYFYSVTR